MFVNQYKKMSHTFFLEGRTIPFIVFAAGGGINPANGGIWFYLSNIGSDDDKIFFSEVQTKLKEFKQ